MAQRVKNPPSHRRCGFWSLGGEDLLEEGMEIHSSILAWRIPWTEEPGGLRSIESQRVRHDWSDFFSTHAFMHSYVCVFFPPHVMILTTGLLYYKVLQYIKVFLYTTKCMYTHLHMSKLDFWKTLKKLTRKIHCNFNYIKGIFIIYTSIHKDSGGL